MSYLIDKYLKRLSEEYHNSKEVLVFCHLVLKEGHFNATHFYEKLQMGNSSTKPIDWSSKLGSYKIYKDNRIRNLTIKNFRKYKSEHTHPYLLDMTSGNQGNCSSVFVVGKNGTGKTSIFTALEYIFNISPISSMAVRGITNVENYLPYGNMSMNEIEVRAELNTQKKNGGYVKIATNSARLKNSSIVDMSSFFCSEKDLREICMQHDLKKTYINNIGLHEVKSLIDELEGELKIQIDKDLELPTIEHETYNIETLQNDILRISCQGFPNYTRYLGQIGLLQEFLAKHPIKTDEKSGKIENFLANKETIILLGRFFSENKFLITLDYFETNLPQIQNYEKFTMLSGTRLLRAFSNLERMTDIEILVKEMQNYLNELLAPFQQANVGEAHALNKVAKRTLENIIRRADSELKREILKKNQTFKVFITDSNIQETVRNFKNSLKQQYEQDCEEYLHKCNDFVVPLLNDFTKISGNSDKEVISIVEKNNGFFAEITCPEISTSYKTSPHLFYNSFRYKLFAISIKISLAFMMMKKYDMIAPIIIDDVFTASDFDNTVNIDLFFSLIYKSFENVVEKSVDDLQIIMFTHDEVVLNGLKEAFLTNDAPNVSYIMGRLLDTKELLPDDYDDTLKGYKLIERYN